MNNVVCLMGPTASGKTALALELIKHFPFEVISVDSAMIYQEMDIGTAKPTAAELRQIPHHLIDIINPTQSFSAAEFCERAHHCCSTVIEKGKIPLLVGGTMMYFHAFEQGLATLPKADTNIRTELLITAQRLGWDKMHQQLQRVDAVSAAKIHPHDSQRIQRALEVFQLTGTPLSSLLAIKNTQYNYNFINVALMPTDRSWLHQRIATRFQAMLAQGFIKEVACIIDKWQLTSAHGAMRCVGYRQVYNYLQQQIDYDSCCFQGIVATRNLAKRQLTWLRHWPNLRAIAPDSDSYLTTIIAHLNKILDNAL